MTFNRWWKCTLKTEGWCLGSAFVLFVLGAQNLWWGEKSASRDLFSCEKEKVTWRLWLVT